MGIPFLIEVSSNVTHDSPCPYIVLYDNGTTASIPLSKMSALIPNPPVDIDSSNSQDSLLPPFLCLTSRISYKHEVQYHKGFLGKRNGVYQFMFKLHVNKCKEDWGVDLPNLPFTWVNICVEGVLVPE
jgi:hypothetical protein